MLRQPNATNIGLDIAPMPKRVSTYIVDQYWPNDVCYACDTDCDSCELLISRLKCLEADSLSE